MVTKHVLQWNINIVERHTLFFFPQKNLKKIYELGNPSPIQVYNQPLKRLLKSLSSLQDLSLLVGSQILLKYFNENFREKIALDKIAPNLLPIAYTPSTEENW